MRERKDQDPEAHALACLVEHKENAALALAAVGEARKARGEDTSVIEDSLELERMTTEGYARALEARRAKVAATLSEDGSRKRGAR